MINLYLIYFSSAIKTREFSQTQYVRSDASQTVVVKWNLYRQTDKTSSIDVENGILNHPQKKVET